MKNISCAIMIPAICLTLAAESTGQFGAQVTTKGGAPIPNAKILIERESTEINWSKQLTTDSKGKAMQAGLAPKEYTITISAEGFVPIKVKRKVPLNDTLKEVFVLLNQEEARAAAKAAGGPVAVDPSAAKETEGSEAFNAAVGYYNEQKYVEALPFIEKAYKALTEASAAMKDPAAKAELDARFPVLERVYGIILSEAGQTDEEKAAFAAKAEPFLVPALARNPKDQRIVTSLIAVATAKGDAAMLKKYQDAMDALIGPRPELAYNDAVAAFNAGDFKKSKVSVTKAIATDPKFADSYWLLGVVEFSLGNTKPAKDAFKKYMEIAPTGKKAGEVKEFLKELK